MLLSETTFNILKSPPSLKIAVWGIAISCAHSEMAKELHGPVVNSGGTAVKTVRTATQTQITITCHGGRLFPEQDVQWA